MPKINEQDQIKVSRHTIGHILMSYELVLKSFAVPNTGIENTTIIAVTDKGKYVLRVYRQNKKSAASISEEVEFAIFLKDHGLPVPSYYPDRTGALVHKENIGGKLWRCVLAEYLPGKPDTEYSPRFIWELASAHAQMNLLGMKFAAARKKLPKPNLVLSSRFFIEKTDFRKIKSSEAQEFFRRARMCKVKLDPKLPSGYNHQDIGYGNILVANGKLSAILDFDDLAYGPVVVCLANAVTDVLYWTQDMGKARLYLKYYSKFRKLDSLERKILKELIEYRNFVIAGFAIMFRRNKELRRYLDTDRLIKQNDFSYAIPRKN